MLDAELATPGPVGLGTQFRAEMRLMRRTVAMTIECTAYDRPRRLASTTHLSEMNIEGSLSFDPVPGGTRMRWQWDLKPHGALRLMTPLIARMGRRQEQTIWTSLKRAWRRKGLRRLLLGGNAANSRGVRKATRFRRAAARPHLRAATHTP